MPPSTLRWLPWFLVPVIALETIVIDLILPALPDMARDFALNPATAQTVISLFLLSYAISQPVSGPLADRFGRRRVLILSMAGVTLAHLGAFLANEFWIVQVCRFLLGLAGGACLAVGLAVFRDLYAEERLTKMFGYVFALAGVLSIVSGLGGGWLAEHGGWHSNMLALTAISAVYVVLLAVLLPETRPENMAPSSFRQWFAEFKVLAGQTHFWTACLANGHNYAVMLIFVSAIPFVLADQYQFQGQQIGNFFALVIGSYTVGSVMAGAFSRFSLKHRSLLGAAHSILPFILTVLFLGQSVQPWSLPFLAAGLFFSIACVGLYVPLINTWQLNPYPQVAGTAAGIMTSTSLIICSLYGWVATHFHDGTAKPMLAVMASSAIIASLFLRLADYLNLKHQGSIHSAHSPG